MYNKSQLIGRLGRDPDVRFTGEGKAVANLAIATTETWKDKASGERKQKTEWHRVVLFGALAEIARDHLKKGALVLLEGPIRTRKWQDQNGHDVYTTEIHADTLKMLGGKSDNSSGSSSASAAPSAKSSSPSNNHAQPAYSAGFDDDFDDDIPF